jgi:hypothetical protein
MYETSAFVGLEAGLRGHFEGDFILLRLRIQEETSSKVKTLNPF